MTQTIRQYAEQLKQGLGMIVGLFEASQGLPADQDKAAWMTSVVNALPPAVIATFPIAKADLATFVLAAGPLLQEVAPVV